MSREAAKATKLTAKSLPRYASVAELCRKRQPETPVYALYPKRIKRAVDRFLKGFPGRTLYAVKANPALPVLDLLYASGVRQFDTASLPEVELISRRFPQAKCHFMTPIRIRGWAGEAYRRYGVRHFVIDDIRELNTILAETRARTPAERKGLTIFVRLATPVEGAFLELSSKFGVDAEQGAELLKAVAEAGCQPALTFHVGTLCIKPEAFAQALDICRHALNLSGVEITALDVGGGFPAPYPGMNVPPMETFFAAIKGARKALKLKPSVELYCEPGRALVAEGVSVVTQVIRRRGERLYINDGIYGSLDEMTLPDWNVEYPRRVFMTTGEKAVVEVGGPRRPFKIFGPTCDTLDVLPKPILLPHTIEAGDYIDFGMVGAYSCALRTAFNGFYPDDFALVNEP